MKDDLPAITTQAQALHYWPDNEGVPLLMGMRGQQHCSVRVGSNPYCPVRARVWERLLERGDLEMRTGGYDMWLWITEQGRARRES